MSNNNSNPYLRVLASCSTLIFWSLRICRFFVISLVTILLRLAAAEAIDRAMVIWKSGEDIMFVQWIIVTRHFVYGILVRISNLIDKSKGMKHSKYVTTRNHR